MHIDIKYIETLLEENRNSDDSYIESVLDKASRMEGLTHKEVAALLTTNDAKHIDRIFKTALDIKKRIYGNRIVIFAPLYISNYCVNRCAYCGFNETQGFERLKLTEEELRNEVRVLEQMGHKRIALEAGESEKHCPIEYVLDSIKTIYSMGIRRINVNIAATTVENYAKLKDANIGTYILFQETYHKPTYEELHTAGPKKNYQYHLTAFDRAMQGGIDDVGGGVLFGLADPYFEVLALMLHNEYLEKEYGVGFHTISVPRLRPSAGMNIDSFPNIVSDDLFKKIVAIIRLAVPFTGLILSTRENYDMRKSLLKIGVSQLSAGSNTEVLGYSKSKASKPQFTVSDDRSAISIISDLISDDYIPSFCTACYRGGRTGDRFMSLAKSGEIKNVCLPNAIMTLCEYAIDYGDEEFRNKTNDAILRLANDIEDERIHSLVLENINKIRNGSRDLFL